MHTRRRFPFLTPRHPHLADARHAAVVLQSAAPPACSTPFHTLTSACTHASPATRPPRRPGHRAHARRATPWPELCSHRAPPPAGAPPRRAGAVPGDLGGKGPGFRYPCVFRTLSQPAKNAGRRLAPSPATLTAPPPLPVSPPTVHLWPRPSTIGAKIEPLLPLVHVPVAGWPRRARLAAGEPLPRRRPSRAFRRAPYAQRGKTPGV
jgi:hypothetical protein